MFSPHLLYCSQYLSSCYESSSYSSREIQCARGLKRGYGFSARLLSGFIVFS